MDAVQIFADGSSKGNPGPGGYGAIVASDGRVQEFGGGEPHTTNNRMELTAAIVALASLSDSRAKITLYTDSSYVVNGITKWVSGWQTNGWQTKQKKDVENRDLWEKLIAAASGKNITWNHVAGHAGIPGNERCDEIANAFATGTTPKLFSGNLTTYTIAIADLKPRHALAEKKSRNKATAYSYVSMVDGIVKTHATWSECEQRVKGVKGGVKFKKATNAEDEASIIQDWKQRV